VLTVGTLESKFVDEAQDMLWSGRVGHLLGSGCQVPQYVKLEGVILAAKRISGKNFESNMAACPGSL
jgi:hypothetical protein